MRIDASEDCGRMGGRAEEEAKTRVAENRLITIDTQRLAAFARAPSKRGVANGL